MFLNLGIISIIDFSSLPVLLTLILMGWLLASLAILPSWFPADKINNANCKSK